MALTRRTWLDGHDADDQDDGPFAASTASTREAEKGRGKLAGFPDDLCLTGSHGVLCDDDDDASHVIGISLGYVSDFSVNPSSVAPSASASATLLTLFVYARPLPPLKWRLPPTLQDLVLVNNPALSGRLAISVACLPLLCKRGGGGRSLVASGAPPTMPSVPRAPLGCLPEKEREREGGRPWIPLTSLRRLQHPPGLLSAARCCRALPAFRRRPTRANRLSAPAHRRPPPIAGPRATTAHPPPSVAARRAYML
uniref:Uncharacterized protein n=1 Tax=Oryza sativa subsp. japonica TaxID=39947 RepID=Q6ZG01_ORYSJ|nr:hypothetical protein [Oryza sativa Japonica Group]